MHAVLRASVHALTVSGGHPNRGEFWMSISRAGAPLHLASNMMTDYRPMETRKAPLTRHAGAKRGRAAAEPPPPLPSTRLSIFDALAFFRAATPAQFDERYARGQIELEYEWRSLVYETSDALFEHILANYGDELAFDWVLNAAADVCTDVLHADGTATRLGRLFWHLAVEKRSVASAEIVRALRRFAGDGVPPVLLHGLLYSLRHAFVRFTGRVPFVSTLEAEQRMMAIGDEFVEQVVTPAARKRMRLMGRHGLATLTSTSWGLDKEQRAILRLDEMLGLLFDSDVEYAKRRGARPRLQILSQ